ncbi:MAG: diguanylate cyclase [Lachnospiraceae bacterium]|nr:diguanylate cyclase [Lachnospiraceae bacterium]
MKLERQKIGKLQMAVLVRTVLPMLVMGIVIIVAALVRTRSSLEEEVYRSLEATATAVAAGFDEMYEGDYVLVGDKFLYLYKGESELTGNFEFVDRIRKESGMDVTLFYQDARILTTLTAEDGSRYVSTGVHPNIMRTMESKQKPIRFKGEINPGHEYYISYVPLFNSDGSLTGMVGTAISADVVAREADNASRPVFIITILGMLIASFISIRYTRGIVVAVEGIQGVLSSMVSGKLNNEMPEKVTVRGDEIAEVGRDITRMQDAVRVLVECDPLTKLYNRRSGDAKMKHIRKEAATTGMPYVIAIGDIDFFKKVNDTYGHDAGDMVLKFVAEELKKLMSGRGHAVRWGGEEFLLFFENRDLVQACAALEDFLDGIRAARLRYQGREIRVTMTVGVVDGDPGRDTEELIKEADEKLYFGKENGRNQLVVTPGVEQPEYRKMLKQGQGQEEEPEEETVITIPDEYLDTDQLMQMLSDNAAFEMEKGGEKETEKKSDEE